MESCGDSPLAYHLIATNFEIDVESLLLGFVNETTGGYFLMQRSEESPDTAQHDLGNVYIERDDQVWGGYGGIERVVLTRDTLTVGLTARMSKRLWCREVRVQFSADEEQYRRVRDQVKRVLLGYEGILSHDCNERPLL